MYRQATASSFSKSCGHVSGLGAYCNRSHREVLGGVSDGFANGFGHGEATVLAATAGVDEFAHVAFGFDDDARHDRDGFVEDIFR